MQNFVVPSPKRILSKDPLDNFFPYYAGFPESFVRSLLSNLAKPGAVVYDPWNGSGTTTAIASRLGYPAIGFDLNPAMAVVAKARSLPLGEVDSILPLTRHAIRNARSILIEAHADDPLSIWFKPRSASILRSIERSCSDLLISDTEDWQIDSMSSIASLLYTALFSTVRNLVQTFRASNPTWLKAPLQKTERLSISRADVERQFLAAATQLVDLLGQQCETAAQRATCEIKVADATNSSPGIGVDCIITSPPYCTRIDYTAATRIELAILSQLIQVNIDELGSRMIGTTKVPKGKIIPSAGWGSQCAAFLEAVRNHHSKASSGYYYKTHVDYFDKMAKSISMFSSSLRAGGTATMIVQDSYYKDIHNNVPSILAEIAAIYGLKLLKKADFVSSKTMSRINSKSRRFGNNLPVESVMCFAK